MNEMLHSPLGTEAAHDDDPARDELAAAQPFATATLARIYIEQGKLQQAKAIFEQLLALRGDDEELARGLSAVEAAIVAQSERLRESGDRLTLTPTARHLECSWEITAYGLAAARRAMASAPGGETGKLILRRISFPYRTVTGPSSSPRRTRSHSPNATALRSTEEPKGTVDDLALDQSSGSLSLDIDSHTCFIVAAVGLLGRRGQFTAITHCGPLPIAISATPSGFDKPATATPSTAARGNTSPAGARRARS